MRNIKTGIAVLISIAISRVLKSEYPFFAAVAAIVAMQSSVEGSLKAGKNRMLGTFVGAIVGYVFALIDPGNVILCSVGIMMVIYLCNILNWKDAVSIGGIVFLAIMLNLDGGSPLYYSLNRIQDTFIGIAVALIINRYIAPPKV
jgi:uncharacterized membrane protein YgaE (UPF0421/DUF939 family)